MSSAVSSFREAVERVKMVLLDVSLAIAGGSDNCDFLWFCL